MRFPRLDRRGLGVGLDLPWAETTGFGGGDVLAAPVRAYLPMLAGLTLHC